MDWSKLYFGKVSPEEVKIAINNTEWQALRESIKGKSLEDKYKALLKYLEDQKSRHLSDKLMRNVEVRLTNYVTALSRGGLIKPSDYRKLS